MGARGEADPRALCLHDRPELDHRVRPSVPWTELNEFYRGSNRRQVRNALWMVEQIAGHTWNTWGSPPAQLSGSEMAELAPLEQLALMGFDHYSALQHGQSRARGLVPLLPPQRLEIRFTPGRLAQDPQQAGRLVGGRKRPGSAQCRGTEFGGHAVEPAPAGLSVASAVAVLHPGGDGRRRTTKRPMDMDVGLGTHHARRRRRLG